MLYCLFDLLFNWFFSDLKIWERIVRSNSLFIQKIIFFSEYFLIKDSITDAFMQQILMRPAEYSVIATLNLNGDYLSDALAAQVGGIGIAPGANMSDAVACFEATHGTSPKYAGKDYVNPGSSILSAEMMLRHMGWTEAADLVVHALEQAILSKRVTHDFARLMDGATQVSCSGFGKSLVEHMAA